MQKYFFKIKQYFLLGIIVAIYLIFFVDQSFIKCIFYLFITGCIFINYASPMFSNFFRIFRKDIHTYHLEKALFKSQLLFIKNFPYTAYKELEKDILNVAIPKFFKNANNNDKLIIKTHLVNKNRIHALIRNNKNYVISIKKIKPVFLKSSIIISLFITNFFKLITFQKHISIKKILKRNWYLIIIKKTSD